MQRPRGVYEEALERRPPLDRLLPTMRREVQWLAVRPALSKQRPCFSDIEERRRLWVLVDEVDQRDAQLLRGEGITGGQEKLEEPEDVYQLH